MECRLGVSNIEDAIFSRVLSSANGNGYIGLLEIRAHFLSLSLSPRLCGPNHYLDRTRLAPPMPFSKPPRNATLYPDEIFTPFSLKRRHQKASSERRPSDASKESVPRDQSHPFHAEPNHHAHPNNPVHAVAATCLSTPRRPRPHLPPDEQHERPLGGHGELHRLVPARRVKQRLQRDRLHTKKPTRKKKNERVEGNAGKNKTREGCSVPAALLWRHQPLKSQPS